MSTTMPYNHKYRALPHARVEGKRWYKVPVLIVRTESRTLTSTEQLVWVISRTAAEAANWVRDNDAAGVPETEIYAWGPLGGVVKRYIGWDTVIMQQVMDRAPTQYRMPL